MNERIIELALQAHLLNYVDNETPRRYFVCGHADVEEVLEFASLVVRECAEIALREDHEPRECVLSHFGLTTG